MDGMRFATGNFMNVITTPRTIYNMNQENRMNARKELGLSKFEINSSACVGNISERIIADDKKRRMNVRDSSSDILGIVRKYVIFA